MNKITKSDLMVHDVLCMNVWHKYHLPTERVDAAINGKCLDENERLINVNDDAYFLR